MNERSKSVLGLALVAVVVGVYGLAAGIALLFGGTLGALWGADSSTGTVVLGSILFALGVVSFGVGGGFWLGKPWAWSAAIVLFSAWALVNLATVLVGASIVSVAVPVVLGGAVVWYLLQPKVRAEVNGLTTEQPSEHGS
jgi:hypothetical protein